jgi:hypothetical protein
VKGEDNIADKYRKQVDKILDSQSDKNSFSPLSQEELDEIWEELYVEMDIDEVWNEISSDLDIVMPLDSHSGSGIIVKSFATILIILIGMIPVRKATLDSVFSQPDILIENRQNGQSADLISVNKSLDTNSAEQLKGGISPVIRIYLDKSKDIKMLTSAEMNRADLKQGIPISLSNEVVSRDLASSEKVDSTLVVSTGKIPIEESSITPALLPEEMEKIEVISKKDFENLIISDNYSTAGFSVPSNEKGKVSVGLITLFKNTWLLNHETLDGLKSESLTTTEMVYFSDVGLSLNYSLNKNWLLQADGFFSSNTGQEYLGYYYGHYTRKEITLNYSAIDLFVKHKFTLSSNFIPRSSINVFAGGYISFLHYAYQKINTDLEDIVSQFEKYDLGVMIGSEFELQLFDQLSIAPGLFLSLGIPNIYKGTSNISDYLRRTQNGSAELHLAIYYHFK